MSEGISRYNALVVEWTRRPAHGLAGRASYTYSVLTDNQIGETNFFTSSGVAPVNNYNYLASLPPCTTTNFAACFNPRADFSHGLLDVPHRLVLSPIWQLPSPGGAANQWLGGWVAAAVVTLQSGFPIGVTQNDGTLLGNGQRPNVVPGASRETPGSLEDRLASADHPTAAWLNPAAFSVAPAGTWGDAPRVVTDVSTPKVLNADVSVSKQIAIGGGRTVEVKAEVFNLFNRVQTNGFASVAAGTTQFGRIASQIGFMRTTQFMIRMSW